MCPTVEGLFSLVIIVLHNYFFKFSFWNQIRHLTEQTYRYILHHGASFDCSAVSFSFSPGNDCYHPGSKYELRQCHPIETGSGNQCVYDKYGQFLIDYYGGGTANYVSPEYNFLEHQNQDVAPFKR